MKVEQILDFTSSVLSRKKTGDGRLRGKKAMKVFPELLKFGHYQVDGVAEDKKGTIAGTELVTRLESALVHGSPRDIGDASEETRSKLAYIKDCIGGLKIRGLRLAGKYKMAENDTHLCNECHFPTDKLVCPNCGKPTQGK